MKIQEGSLLYSLSAVNRYNARDLADLCFLYAVSLHILRQEFEFAPWVRRYAHDTLRHGDWDQIRVHETDLYQFLNILGHQSDKWLAYVKNPQASHLLLEQIHVDHYDWMRFLRNLIAVKYDTELSARLLLKFEQDLKISISNYKSMRRIASDWDQAHVTTEAKSLVVTRMLQALRHKAARGDILKHMEQFGRESRLELQQVCDPETQKGCEPAKGPATSDKKPSLMKQLAIGAGLGVGAYLLGKALFSGNK